MGPLRIETRARARALQLLYAWDLQGRPPLPGVADRLLGLGRGPIRGADLAEGLARGVVEDREALDGEIEACVEGWRLSRIGTIEVNILRLALHELKATETPPRVVIDEAVRLAHWFAGPKAPAFVNGVLDALARQRGRL